jgi:hypothetical protein
MMDSLSHLIKYIQNACCIKSHSPVGWSDSSDKVPQLEAVKQLNAFLRTLPVCTSLVNQETWTRIHKALSDQVQICKELIKSTSGNDILFLDLLDVTKEVLQLARNLLAASSDHQLLARYVFYSVIRLPCVRINNVVNGLH